MSLEPTAEQIAAFVAQARRDGFALALAASKLEEAAEQVSEQESEALEEREPELKTMSLLDLVEAAEARARRVLLRRNAGLGWPLRRSGALLVPLDAVQELLEDAAVPKRVHDLKATLRVLESAWRCAARRQRTM